MMEKFQITAEEYNKIHPDFRGVWETERWDLPDWEKRRERYMGKRTLLYNLNGCTCLLIEGISFEIVDNQIKTV